jgi:2-oxoglutarate ferredoxin oxidoreductase subunit alpha
MDPLEEEKLNKRLLERQAQIEAQEVRLREYWLEDADYAVVAFGTAGRIALSAVKDLREEGHRVGLLRPISLYPYPKEQVAALAEKVRAILVVEMNSGQMLDDVRLAVEGRAPIEFYGRMGGVVPMPDEIVDQLHALIEKYGG